GGFAKLRYGQSTADHQGGQFAGVGGGGVCGGDRGASADHGDLVGHGQDLVEFVRDEDDGEPLAFEFPQVVEEFVDLLRDEDGRGLVEDDRLGPAVEDLEDLHTLAVPHTQVLHESVRVDPKTVLVGQFPDVGTGSAADTVPAFGTQDHVLQHGEVVGEHEVLVHHADTVLDGLRGRVETYLLAADEEVALVRPVHAVQGLHQRGLARAVLADDRGDGAGRHAAGAVVGGAERWERMGGTGQRPGVGLS